MAGLLGHTRVRTGARYAHLAADLVKAAAQAAVAEMLRRTIYEN